MTLIVRTFDGDELGSITLKDGVIDGSTPSLHRMAATRLRRFGDPQKAYDSLKGTNNGYITISEDSGQVRVAARRPSSGNGKGVAK